MPIPASSVRVSLCQNHNFLFPLGAFDFSDSFGLFDSLDPSRALTLLAFLNVDLGRLIYVELIGGILYKSFLQHLSDI